MKTFAFALCATLCFVTPSFVMAQDAAPPPPADQGGGAPPPDAGAPPPDAGGPGADAGAPAGGGKGGKMKEAIKACREQAKAQGVAAGKDMKQAIMDCVSKQSPRMANVLKCRMEGKEKGLKPGSDEMKAFVKDCKKNGS